MIPAILSIIKNCCPCLWKTSAFAQYHKRIGETEHQSFMRDSIEPVHERTHSQSSKPLPIQQGIPRIVEKQQPLKKPIQELPQLQKSYTNCLALDHQFYTLLHPKLQQLPTIFDIQTQPQTKIAQNNYNLKIYIQQSEDDKTNIFVYSFEFPTTYQFYEEMQNNFQLQKTFDGNIDQYQCLEEVDQTTKVIYLAYKKILIVSPRDFTYVRYTFKKNQEYWAIATSLPDSKPVQGKERGRILLTATRAIEKDNKLYLTVYSQVDIKMPVKASAAKVRGITEIKKYLDKCYDYVQKETNSII